MCNIMGWHGPKEVIENDGVNIHIKCKWCGQEGMVDSQGNFFEK